MPKKETKTSDSGPRSKSKGSEPNDNKQSAKGTKSGKKR